jgi:hypothetical protein
VRSLILLLFFLLSALPGCAEFRPSWIREDSYSVGDGATEITEEDFDGPRRGHFDEEGNWIPDDGTIEWTYKIPDISSGFIFDVATQDATPSIQVELLEFDIPKLPYFATWKLDAGVAYQRAYLYFGPLITSIFEISIGGFVGWNWEDEELSYGIGFTIIKF